MRNSKKIIFSLLGLLLFATVLPSSIKAYTHNGSKISNPNNAYYWIHGEFSKYGLKGEVLEGHHCLESFLKIQFTKESSLPGGANVKIEYVDRYNGDTYGIFRGSWYVTLFKNLRVELDSARRKETAVHEVGHALGL